jgi:hypothetical protein
MPPSSPGNSEFQTRRDNDGNLVIVRYTGRSETVVIPAEFEGLPVVGIGERAFSGNTTMKSLSIPEGVTFIDEDAFDNCTRLTDIAIPASVIRIGEDVNDAEDAFDGCTELTDIRVAEANETYSSEDGVLFNKDKTTLIHCPNGKSGSYTIPSSVTDIARLAFEDCGNLTSVTIPDSVVTLGERSFEDCIGLTSITIPGSIKVITGDIRGAEGYVYGVFVGCTGLTSVVILDGVTTIGDTAFFGCTRLSSVTIPGSVTSIGRQTFAACAALTSITIPDSVTSIGNGAFQESGLTSIVIPDSLTYIGGNAFTDCASLTSVRVSPVDGRTWDDRVLNGAGTGAGAFVDTPLNAESEEALRAAGYRGGI